MTVALAFCCLLYGSTAQESHQPKKSEQPRNAAPQGGMPLSSVVVTELTSGTIAPQAQFIATVYYREVSEVASEVEGKVIAINFEAGQQVKDGEQLVSLSADLLEETLKASQANYEEVV